jgi:hypothetical protein
MENTTEDFRKRQIARLARCLFGEVERGSLRPKHKAPRILAGINMIVDGDIMSFAAEIETEFNRLLDNVRHSPYKSGKVSVYALNMELHLNGRVVI